MLPQDIEKLKAEFGDRAFSGRDVARVLGTHVNGTGGIFKYMRGRGMVRMVRSGAYQFVAAKPEAPKVEITPVAPPASDQPPSSSLVRIGELYLHERLLLIADTARQDGSPAVRLYTTIIEVDPATKHPRNKIINFIKVRDPHEYAQAIAWLDSMAGELPHVVDDTGLELAAELEIKLNAANAEIAELKAWIKNVQAAFNEASI